MLGVSCTPEQRAIVVSRLLQAGLGQIPLRVVDEGALAAAADSRHHEGLVLAVRPRRFLSVGELGALLLSRRGTAVALDRVRNPYNVGAILRTAAFFGVDALLLGAPAPHPALHPDAVRVGEGGAEHLGLARTTDLATTLRRLRERGVGVVAAESQEGQDAARFPFARPLVLVLGHEREGLSDRVRTECTARIHIRGSGSLDSLNVSVAAGVLIGMLTGHPASTEGGSPSRRTGAVRA